MRHEGTRLERAPLGKLGESKAHRYYVHATALRSVSKYCWVMCSCQRMKRDNVHALYSEIRTYVMRQCAGKNSFDTEGGDRARLLIPTLLTVHRFAFVAFHSSVTAHKSNT